MNEGWRLAAAAAAGLLLGGCYFAGLWWTVRRLPRAARPGLWLGGSFVLRMVPVLGVFYLLLRQGVALLAVALLGFLVARLLWLAVGGRGAGGRNRSRPAAPSGNGESWK